MSRHDRISRAAIVSSGALGLVLIGGGAALAATPADLLPTGLLPSPSASGSQQLPVPTVSLPGLPLPTLPLPVPTTPAPTTGSATPSPTPSSAPSTGGSTTPSGPGTPVSGSGSGPGSSSPARSGGVALPSRLAGVGRLRGALASGVRGLVGGALPGTGDYGPGVHPDLLSAQDLAGRYGFAAPASDQAVPAPVVASPMGAGQPQALSTPTPSGDLGTLASASSGRGDDSPTPGLGVVIATVAVGAAGAAHVGYLQLRPRR